MFLKLSCLLGSRGGQHMCGVTTATDPGDRQWDLGCPCRAPGDKGDRAASQGLVVLAGFGLDVLIRSESQD